MSFFNSFLKWPEKKNNLLLNDKADKEDENSEKE